MACKAHLVADGAAVDVVEALQHLAQRADGALLAQEALHVPRAQEEPGTARSGTALQAASHPGMYPRRSWHAAQSVPSCMLLQRQVKGNGQ